MCSFSKLTAYLLGCCSAHQCVLYPPCGQWQRPKTFIYRLLQLKALCGSCEQIDLFPPGEHHRAVDPCEAAKFSSVVYFSTQGFGINIQLRIKNLTFLNDWVCFSTTILNIKAIDYFKQGLVRAKKANLQRNESIFLGNIWYNY